MQHSSWHKKAMRRGAFACVLACVLPAGARAQAAAPAPAPDPAALETWFPQLRQGLWVEIEGAWADGVLHAEEIKIMRGDLDQAEISSVITAADSVAGRIRTALGLEIAVSWRTEMEKDARRGWTAIVPGALVEAEGPMQRDGSLLADELEVKPPSTKPRPAGWSREHELTGRIETVDAATRTLRVSGVTVRCDARTRNKTRLTH